MKMPRLLITPLLCGFAGVWQSLLLAGPIQPKNAASDKDRTPSVLEADSLGLPDRDSFGSTACIITAVQANEEVLTVGFAGEWISSLIEKASDTGQNGFSISRDPAVSRATWGFFVRRFEDCRGKLVTISISTNGGSAVRGGIPFFDFPTNRFEITQPDLSTTPTPFSSIPMRAPRSAASPKAREAWRNPRIRIRDAGIFVNDSPKTTAPEALLETLAYLPKDAWRYGRVVAISAFPRSGSDKDPGEQKAIVERVVAILKSAGIESDLSKQSSNWN